MDTPELVTTVRQLGGIVSTGQLLDGFSRMDLDHALASGELIRIARGRYATTDVEESLLAARSVSGVISGLSAARWWRWPVKWDPERPVVTVPRNRSVTRSDIDVRRQDLPADAVVDGTVTTQEQTVIDCARSLPFDEALAIADSALRDGGVTREELMAAAMRSPRTGRTRAARVVEYADGRAANPFESVVRAIALDVTELRLVPQVEIEEIGWADLVDAGRRLVVECESWAFHASKQAFARDLRRYTGMACAGWTVARFGWDDAMHHPERVRQSLAHLAARAAASG